MTWRILGISSCQADYDRLSDAERLQLDEDLLGWVDDGAPCRVMRVVLGVEGFDDLTTSGFRITYLVSQTDRYVAVLRIRKEQ